MSVRLLALLGVRDDERVFVVRALWFAGLAVGSVGLVNVAGDALLASRLSLPSLSRFYAVASVAKVAATFGYGALSARLGQQRVDRAVLAASVAVGVACVALSSGRSTAATLLIGLLLSLVPPLLPLVSFNAVASGLHARQAKRLLPIFAAAATTGVVLASALSRAASSLGLTPLFALFTAMVVAAMRASPAATSVQSVAQKSGGSGSTIAATLGDLRESPVVRLMAFSVVVGAVASSLVDFALKIELRRTMGEAQMAGFLGLLSLGTSALLLLLQLVVTGPFLSRLGVSAGLAAFPATLAVCGPLMALLSPPWPMAAAKVSDGAVRFSLGGAVSDLVLMPLPVSVRTRAKVLVKGGAFPLGGVLASALLSTFGEQAPSARELGLLVLGLGVVGVAAALPLRNAYRDALSASLGAGRFVLDVSPGSAAALRQSIASTLQAAVARGDAREARALLAVLADRFFSLRDIGTALSSADREIRGAALDAAASIAQPGDGELLLSLVAPAEPAVEARVLQIARSVGAKVPRERVERAVSEAEQAEGDAGLWAEAMMCMAMHDREGALRKLRRAAAADGSPQRPAALRALGELSDRRGEREVRRALASDEGAVFAEAARASVRMGVQGAVAMLVRRLSTGPHVRAAARALAIAGPDAIAELLMALPTTVGEKGNLRTALASGSHLSGNVRAARVLARLGPDACTRVLKQIDQLGFRARMAICRGVVGAAPRVALEPSVVHGAIEVCVSYAELLRAVHGAAGPGLLRLEAAHRIRESAARALDVASLLGHRDLIAQARSALSREGREREQALELLEQTLPTGQGRRIVSLLEWRDEGQAPAGEMPHIDGWLALCRQHDLGPQALDPTMHDLLSKVLSLRESSLFAGLSGEELYPVAEIATVEHHDAGAAVVREGDPGDALYVLCEGELEVQKAGKTLKTLQRGAAFGELSLLDGAPRAATIVARGPSAVLRIPRAGFEALLDESPELSRGLIRTLLGHIRA